MRVLAIGQPLPNPAIDNHTIFNAPTVFDYEAIVVDPGGVFTTIREAADASAEHRTHSDVAIANGETTATATGIAEVLRRRRDEFARALERGAVVAVFAYPPATLREVSGFSGCDRYFFLPAPEGLGWDGTLLRGGEGATAAVVDHAHPFAAVVDALRPDLLYRAYFDDRAPGFAAAGHVFARSPGGAPVGVEFAVGGGRVVFLPARRGAGGHEAPAIARAIVDAMEAALAVDDAERPRWVDGQALPGLAELEAAAVGARDRRDAASDELAEAQRAAASLAQLRDVLWRAGHGLGPAAVRCLELLGFERMDEQPMRLRAAEGTLHVEVEGSRESVGMASHYRLRERLDALIAKEREAPRGLVVANGERLSPPERREASYDDALRVAAEATGYALLTAGELFAAARDALEGAGEETLAAMRQRLLSTDGVVTLSELVKAGPPPERVGDTGA